MEESLVKAGVVGKYVKEESINKGKADGRSVEGKKNEIVYMGVSSEGLGR